MIQTRTHEEFYLTRKKPVSCSLTQLYETVSRNSIEVQYCGEALEREDMSPRFYTLPGSERKHTQNEKMKGKRWDRVSAGQVPMRSTA